MRAIKKRAPPSELTEWRQHRRAEKDASAYPFTYDALRASEGIVRKLHAQLIAEQGGICAYTGRRITLACLEDRLLATFHIEHLLPQAFCTAEHGHEYEDTDYQNMVACWPEPNPKSAPPFGAHKKGSWPSPQEQTMFVSPLEPSCQQRFRFRRTGQIEPTRELDEPARITIDKLGLNHPTLVALRKQAILGALAPKKDKWLSRAQQAKVAADHRIRASRLDQGGNETLEPYCFAIESALSKTAAPQK